MTDTASIERRVLRAMTVHRSVISFGYEEVTCGGPDPECKHVNAWDRRRLKYLNPHDAHLRAMVRRAIRGEMQP